MVSSFVSLRRPMCKRERIVRVCVGREGGGSWMHYPEIFFPESAHRPESRWLHGRARVEEQVGGLGVIVAVEVPVGCRPSPLAWLLHKARVLGGVGWMRGWHWVCDRVL